MTTAIGSSEKPPAASASAGSDTTRTPFRPTTDGGGGASSPIASSVTAPAASVSAAWPEAAAPAPDVVLNHGVGRRKSVCDPRKHRRHTLGGIAVYVDCTLACGNFRFTHSSFKSKRPSGSNPCSRNTHRTLASLVGAVPSSSMRKYRTGTASRSIDCSTSYSAPSTSKTNRSTCETFRSASNAARFTHVMGVSQQSPLPILSPTPVRSERLVHMRRLRCCWSLAMNSRIPAPVPSLLTYVSGRGSPHTAACTYGTARRRHARILRVRVWNSWWFCGDASISKPFHFWKISKKYVTEKLYPSRPPSSMKKPLPTPCNKC
mmetsp:Transcript_25525/g.78786  ORF Transcript_25525/g.78786 Transcript_25525/m.78786 type:complete len:319 (+) Transcript_25525:28-984(+)